MAGSLRGERLARVERLPGRKFIVLGNHDLDRKGKPLPTGCDESSMGLLVKTSPPLLVTHIPLNRVPRGAVNVYGHVHNNEPLRNGRLINMCVEHTGYRPLHLGGVLALARALMLGCIPPGATTAARLKELRMAGTLKALARRIQQRE